MSIPFATSAAARINLGSPEKIVHNLFLERDETDPDYPWALVETPGSLQRSNFAGACRGMWQADGHASGKTLIAQGSTLSTFNQSDNTAGSLTGTLPGSDDGDAAFAENGAIMLFDGKLCFSDGTYVRRATDGVLDDPNLAIGSTKPNVATGAFDYSINGTTFSKTAVSAGTAPGNDVIPTGKYGAVALDIGVNGTIDAVEAPDNATGYDTAAEAAAALPAPADAHIRIGYVTATKSDGAFTFGTTDLDVANSTVVYADSSVNTAFSDLLDDADETDYTSVATLGQRPLFTFGPRFGFGSVGTSFDLFRTTTALSYYTAESSPDDLIAGRVVGELYYLFGTQTIEAWAETGDADDPFSLQPGMTQQVGCLCRAGIVRADNTLFFVDNAFNVRRLGPGGSPIVSEPWIVDMLRGAGATDIRGMYYEDKGHIFVGWRTSVGCVFYDVLASAQQGKAIWHTRGTNLTDTWRYTHVVAGGQSAGRVFVCDATGQFDELSRDYTSESMADASTDGTYIAREWTAHGKFPEFETIPALMLVCSHGAGTPTGQGANPVVQMRISFDGGSTWTSWRSRALGAQGEYGTATIFRMNGSARRRGAIFHFRKSDPATHVYKALEPVAA